jgi:hypothetical protein
MSKLFQDGGCLSDDGIRALTNASIGGIPPELARHLAGCLACQRRVLAADVPVRAERGNVQPPTWGRTAFYIGVILFMALLALYTTLRLR